MQGEKEDIYWSVYYTFNVRIEGFRDIGEMDMAEQTLYDFASAAGGVDKLKDMLGTNKSTLRIQRIYQQGKDANGNDLPAGYADNDKRVVAIYGNQRVGSGGLWTNKDGCGPISGCLGFKDTLVHELSHIWAAVHPEVFEEFKARAGYNATTPPAYPVAPAGYPDYGYPSHYAQVGGGEDFAESVMIFVYGKNDANTFGGPGRTMDNSAGGYRSIYGARYLYMKELLPGVRTP